jgi:hypothetical protein
MTKVLIDAATRARFNNLEGVLEVCDEAGKTLGYFHPVMESKPSARSPYSREELEGFRRQRTGKPLAEILERLKKL